MTAIRIAQADSPIPEYRGEPVSADPAFTVRAEPSINRGFAFQHYRRTGGRNGQLGHTESHHHRRADTVIVGNYRVHVPI